MVFLAQDSLYCDIDAELANEVTEERNVPKQNNATNEYATKGGEQVLLYMRGGEGRGETVNGK